MGEKNWIKVEDELPAPYYNNLVVYIDTDGDAQIGLGAYQEVGDVWLVADEMGYPEVTHWMPLPDLPDTEVN